MTEKRVEDMVHEALEGGEGITQTTGHDQKPWMILGAKFRSWANFPWFFQNRDSLF